MKKVLFLVLHSAAVCRGDPGWMCVPWEGVSQWLKAPRGHQKHGLLPMLGTPLFLTRVCDEIQAAL